MTPRAAAIGSLVFAAGQPGVITRYCAIPHPWSDPRSRIPSQPKAVTVRLQSSPRRSLVPVILLSIVAGATLALVLVLVFARDGSEPLVTGSVLLAFGIGWALMAYLADRFGGQPQPWMFVPAAAMLVTGLVLVVLQPGPSLMDLASWVWPVALATLAIWMFVEMRRQLHGRARWLVGALTAALLLIAVAGGLTTVGTAMTPRDTGSGRLVDVGGRSLYLECTGSGSPPVILQAGLGGSATAWQRIAPTVAQSTTVCAYDRAGHNRSDEAPGPQDGVAVATDLRDLLANARVDGPYVVAAHSSGGPYTLDYFASYPDDVLGMVLLDAQPPDAFAALPEYPAFYQGYSLLAGVAPSLARVGLLGPVLGVSGSEATAAAARGGRDEVRALPTVLDQAAAVTSVGDRPLIVISASPGSQPGWMEAQARLPGISTNAVQRVLEATHESVILGDDAPASAQAILDVLAAVRGGGRVGP
jgi:pimeloyl-ACP methyl ester carboxylesterase